MWRRPRRRLRDPQILKPATTTNDRGETEHRGESAASLEGEMWRFVTVRVFAGALSIALLGSCGGGSGASGTQTLPITADSPPAGTTGQAYPVYTFTASGGAPPLSWTASGSMPPGLTLSGSGQLSGVPGTAGTYAFAVTVTDSSKPPLTGTS